MLLASNSKIVAPLAVANVTTAVLVTVALATLAIALDSADGMTEDHEVVSVALTVAVIVATVDLALLAKTVSRAARYESSGLKRASA